jgi:hypothetical protein
MGAGALENALFDGNSPRRSEPAPVPLRVRASRLAARRWIQATAGLVAAAAIAAAVCLGIGGSPNPLEQQVLDEAIRCFLAADEPGAAGSKTIAPTGYPLSHWVVQVAGTRCRALSGFFGRPGVAYRLPGPGGVHAVLYVVCPRHRLEGFRTSPAPRPFTTAGCCASAWQENGLLYVLVVKGEAAGYEAYLNLPREPVV